MKRKKKGKPFMLYVLGILLIIVLASMLFLSISGKEERQYPLRDKCSLMIGSLLHSIKDESSCRVACRNECSTREQEFVKVNFTEKEDRCNLCDCYCKG